MMLRSKSRRREQGNAQRGQNQLGGEGFHFCLLRLRSPLAVYVHWILQCTSLVQSPACHDIVSQSQLVNGNITATTSLFILQCNKLKNEADKFLSRRKGLRAYPQHLPLSAARDARAGVKSLYLPEGNSWICENRIAGICALKGINRGDDDGEKWQAARTTNAPFALAIVVRQPGQSGHDRALSRALS